MITDCPICQMHQTHPDRHWCDLCLVYDEMLYHERSVAQTKMWKRVIFTDDEHDIDGLIAYHVELYNGLKLIIKIMENEQ